jgi:hypothetical protein
VSHFVPSPKPGFPWILTSAATALVLGALLYALRAASTEHAILEALDGPLAVGGTVVERVSGATDATIRLVRVPALCLLVFAGLGLYRRAGAALGMELLAVSFGLAAIAQSYLLDWHGWKGFGVYTLAAVAYLVRPRSASAAAVTLPVRIELVALLGALALFLTAGLYRLDLYPPIALDEVAYLTAARHQLGEATDAIPKLYPFEHFHAQIIPLLLHSGAVALLPPGLLSLRLVGVVLGAGTLVCAALALRGRLGPLPVLAAVTLTGISLVFLTHVRLVGYFSCTLLHGTLCFWALIRFCERRDRPSAAVLGALLGLSLYLYQLSWFVPLLSMAVLALRPEVRRHAPAHRALVYTLVVGLAVMTPAIAMRREFAAVGERTFDARALWAQKEKVATLEIELAIVMTRRALSPEGLDRLQARVEEDGVRVVRAEEPLRPDQVRLAAAETGRDHSILRIGGAPAGVKRVLQELRTSGVRTLFAARAPNSVIGRLQEILAQLFAGPYIDESGSFSDGPALHPVVAPLIVLGVLAAVRRRQEPVMTVLLVWVVGGALVPALVGGPYPRRTLLMLPFCYALAAFPLLEAATRHPRRQTLVWLVSFALVIYLALAGSQLYHYGRFDPVAPRGLTVTTPLFELAKAAKTVPGEGRILVPGRHRWILNILREVEGDGRIEARPDATTPARVRQISCAQTVPFAWIARDTPEQDALLAALGTDFSIAIHGQHGYRVHLVTERRADACRGLR